MRDVAKSTAGRKLLQCLAPSAGLLLVLIAGNGCMRSGLDAADLKPDRSLTTGSIPKPAAAAPQTDGGAVKEAVAAADPSAAPQGIPWANAATGTVGVISYVEEVHDDERTCRKFETSRHSFDGIAVFTGEACRGPGQPWTLIGFGPKDGGPAPDASSG
ncbi:MAG: RT0821/Lpp0805 family surface protein [Pararhizobium sp.]